MCVIFCFNGKRKKKRKNPEDDIIGLCMATKRKIEKRKWLARKDGNVLESFGVACRVERKKTCF